MREKGQYSKGMIMEFVNKAVLNMLAMERAETDSINTHSTHTHFAPKALELRNKIIDDLRAKYNFENLGEVTIAKSMLDEAIIAVESVADHRAINNRIELLKSKGYIKESEDSNKLTKRYIFILNSEHMKKQEM
jgi:hypothetical protein